MTDRIYADSNILIYYIDGSMEFKSLAENILTSAMRNGHNIFSSELVVGECLRGAWRHGEPMANIYLSMFSKADFITLEPITFKIIKRAAQLGAELKMKLIDAIHVATAEALRCNIFLTNDRGIRAPAGIELRYLSADA